MSAIGGKVNLAGVITGIPFEHTGDAVYPGCSGAVLFGERLSQIWYPGLLMAHPFLYL